MPYPRLRMDYGNYIECVGTTRSGSAPYLFVGDKTNDHITSGPVSTSKRDMLALEKFLRRSLEAVTGKKVVLK